MTENQINLYPRRTAPELTDYLLGITDPDSSPTTMIVALEKIRRRALDPWMELPTCTYVSATSFTIDEDWTALLKLGVYWSGYNASQKYGYVLSSTYNGGADKTTVNLVANTSYALAAGAITSAKFAYSPPPDFPIKLKFDASASMVWNGTAPSGSPSKSEYFWISNGVCTVKINNSGYTAGATNTQVTFTAPLTTTANANGIAHIGSGETPNLGYSAISGNTIYGFCASVSANRLLVSIDYPVV